MPKKADTPQRKARRNYEVRNKDAREQATMQFNTRLPREECDEICASSKTRNQQSRSHSGRVQSNENILLSEGQQRDKRITARSARTTALALLLL